MQHHHDEDEDAEPRVLLPLDDTRRRLVREEGDILVRVRGQGEQAGEGMRGDEWVFPSSIYPSLTANIPKMLMEWADWPFGREVDMFPGHREILEYVQGYFRRLGVREIRGRGRGRGGATARNGGGGGGGEKGDEKEDGEEAGVRAWFGKVVRKVEKVPAEGREGREWRVVVGDVDGKVGGVGEGEERYYDAIVIAAGRYSVPYIPELPGLKEWVLAGKGKRSVEHSREFREVEERYKGKVSVYLPFTIPLLLPLPPPLHK